jgi:hypothetical protein
MAHSVENKCFCVPKILIYSGTIGARCVLLHTAIHIVEIVDQDYKIASVVLAEGLCPEADIRRLLEFWRDFMAEAPLDLKWNVDLHLAPRTKRVPVELRGRPVAGNSLVWTGAPEGGRPYLERALSMCNPNSVSSRIVSFLNLQTMADSAFPHGRRYYTKSGYFTYLDDGSIDRMVEAVAAMPSSETLIELAYLGGAAAYDLARSTSFGLGRVHGTQPTALERVWPVLSF